MQVYGHRGAAGEAPENTLAGLHHAIERGLHYVEIDLRLSADQKIIVCHDSNTLRTCGIKRAINRSQAAELAKLDGRASAPEWPNKTGCGIPQLRTLIQQCASLKGYQLEVKTESQRHSQHMAKQLKHLFPESGDCQKIVVTSFDGYFLQQLQQRAPHIPRGLVSMHRQSISQASALSCRYFCIHDHIVTPALIKKIHAKGMHCSVWTVNQPSRIKELFQWQVDSLVTDYPSMALPLVKRLIHSR